MSKEDKMLLEQMNEIKHYTCENCGKLDLFKCMGTGLCQDCLEYSVYEMEKKPKRKDGKGE